LDKMDISDNEISLTPAVFDNGPSVGEDNILEENIITSTGPFIIRWKFRHIKLDYKKPRDTKNPTRRPEIIRQKETVVDRCFLFDKNSVVAALENDINFMTLGSNEDQDESEEPDKD